MTNGEKIQTILNVDRDCTEVHGENGTMTFTVTQDFWNAEYKEPDSVIDLIWEEIENIYLAMPDDYNHFQRTKFYLEIKRVFDRYRIGEIYEVEKWQELN